MAKRRGSVADNVLRMAWFFARKHLWGMGEKDKEDFVQDVAYKYFKGADNRDEFQSTLLFLICRQLRYAIANKTLRVYQHSATSVGIEEAYWVGSDIDLHSAFEKKDIWDQATGLPDKKDRIKILVMLSEGYTYKEISDQLGIAEPTVMSRRQMGIKHIKENLRLND